MRALGMGKEQWLKCPKEHIYSTKNFGGFMQFSKCKECGSAEGEEI